MTNGLGRFSPAKALSHQRNMHGQLVTHDTRTGWRFFPRRGTNPTLGPWDTACTGGVHPFAFEARMGWRFTASRQFTQLDFKSSCVPGSRLKRHPYRERVRFQIAPLWLVRSLFKCWPITRMSKRTYHAWSRFKRGQMPGPVSRV